MEQAVDRRYWSRLNEKYQQWYQDYDLSDKISIDANSYNPDSVEDIHRIASQVKTMLNSSQLIPDNVSYYTT